jgi:hypothetical protein
VGLGCCLRLGFGLSFVGVSYLFCTSFNGKRQVSYTSLRLLLHVHCLLSIISPLCAPAELSHPNTPHSIPYVCLCSRYISHLRSVFGMMIHTFMSDAGWGVLLFRVFWRLFFCGNPLSRTCTSLSVCLCVFALLLLAYPSFLLSVCVMLSAPPFGSMADGHSSCLVVLLVCGCVEIEEPLPPLLPLSSLYPPSILPLSSLYPRPCPRH